MRYLSFKHAHDGLDVCFLHLRPYHCQILFHVLLVAGANQGNDAFLNQSGIEKLFGGEFVFLSQCLKCMFLQHMGVGSEGPKTLILHVIGLAELPQNAVIVGVSVKSVLQEGRLHFGCSVQLLEKRQTVTVADAQILYLSLAHELLEFAPNLHSLLQIGHWAVQNQRIQILCLQVLQGHLQRRLHLHLKRVFWVIGNIVGVLSVEGSILCLQEDLVSRYFGPGYSFPYTTLVVVFWLAGSVHSPEALPQSQLYQLSRSLFLPRSPIKDSRNALHKRTIIREIRIGIQRR